MVKLY